MSEDATSMNDTDRLHVDLGTGLGGWTAPLSVSGENPEERAKIPYELADAVRRSVEVFE